MLRRRVIPALLLRNGGLVKTTRFSDPKYVGDPINAVKIFNDKEADELFLFDIGASRDRKPPNFKLIEEIVSEAFMPVAYGGGIRTVDHARTLLSLGVEKVAVSTVAIEAPTVLGDISQRFGAQCLVGVVDVKKRLFGGYSVHSSSGAKVGETDPLTWAERLVDAGAGEILVQSVDRDGTQSGFDLDLLRCFHRKLRVPLVAAGGAGSVEHMRQAFAACELSGLAVGARFVYHGPHRAVLINYLSSRELTELQATRATTA